MNGGPFAELDEASIAQLQAAMDGGRLTAQALVEMFLARIKALDQNGPQLHALLELNPAEARVGQSRGACHVGRLHYAPSPTVGAPACGEGCSTRRRGIGAHTEPVARRGNRPHTPQEGHVAIAPDLFTVAEAAEMLGLSPSSVRYAVKRGLITPVQVHIRLNAIPRSEIERYRRKHLGRRGKRAQPEALTEQQRKQRKQRAYQQAYYQRKKAAREQQPAAEPAE